MATPEIIEATEAMSGLVGRVATDKDRIALTQGGKVVAAMVPAEDLALLEALEDRMDAEDLRQALKEWEEEGRPTVPLEQVLKELGLDG